MIILRHRTLSLFKLIEFNLNLVTLKQVLMIKEKEVKI